MSLVQEAVLLIALLIAAALALLFLPIFRDDDGAGVAQPADDAPEPPPAA